MEKIESTWKKALSIIEPELTPISYVTWVQPLVPIKIDPTKMTLYLSINSEMAKPILEQRYSILVESAVKQAFGKQLKVIYISPDDNIEDFMVKKDNSLSSDHFTDEMYLNPRYNFNTFVIGNNNKFAHAASLAVSESPSGAYNPLFIYGGAGLGKTHLMHAIGHFINHSQPDLKVLYVSSEMFTNELIKAIKDQKTIQFRNKYRSIDVLLIDDIQFIERKESTQEEIFHTFNSLYEANKQIIISSDRPPREITTLNERLRSRFEWGLVADIQTPDYETRVAILRNKAELEGLELSDSILEIITIIAEKIHSNIRELEGAFIRVIAHGSLLNRKIDKDLAREVLKDVFSSKENQTAPEIIKKIVCKHYNIKVSEIESSKRARIFSNPRQVAMYLCREMTDLSLPKIGEFFGKRDHTTVLHAYDKIALEKNTNNELRTRIEELESEIRNT